jgi:hypothetical protein
MGKSDTAFSPLPFPNPSRAVPVLFGALVAIGEIRTDSLSGENIKELKMKKGLLTLLALALVAQSSAFASNETFDSFSDDQVSVEGLQSAAEVASELGDHHGRGLYPRPFPRPRPRPVRVTCYAQNLRGQLFPAVGYDPYVTQDQAVRYCNANSLLRCVAAGCEYSPY